MKKQVKIALGCGWRNYGKNWIHIDNGNYKHLDIKTDIRDLSMIKNGSVDIIYASHVLEYFDRNEAELILWELYDKLKKDGELYLAVPDFEAMSYLYTNERTPLHRFVGPLYGKMEMGDSTIFHKTVYDYASLGELLKSSDFKGVELYDPVNLIGNVDDHSKAMVDGCSISLNVRCKK